MGVYQFISPDGKQTRFIIQKAFQRHEFYDENGIKWERVFTAPQIATDTKIDAFSSRDFVSKTGRKNEKLGDIWDRAKDASSEREKRAGRDNIKENFYSNYSKIRRNRKHQDVRIRELKQNLDKKGVILED